MSLWTMTPEVSAWFGCLAGGLDVRSQARFVALLGGVAFGRGRRTVTSWLRAAGIADDFRPAYGLLGTVGRRAAWLAAALLVRVALPRLAAGQSRLLFALDDTPTPRYGPRVEGAGLHHNPAPGPAGAPFVYGHVWVTLAWVVRHRRWGAIALPLRAALYVRRQDVGTLPPWYGWAFRTKLALAAELLRWLATWVQHRGQALWLVADGAYARREVLRAARREGVTVVSRLRRDAALCDLPGPRPAGRRGRPPVYGRRLSLAKRAGQRRGWQVGEFALYGRRAQRRYKTFQATWRPAGGVIRVVLTEQGQGWAAFFCTDPEASAADVLTAVADRAALEQAFHDLKEVWGAGQQQLRNLWANAGAFHLNLWLHTLVEVWAWDRRPGRLIDRAAAPWDDPGRRPSHADRRRALQRTALRAEYRAAAARRGQTPKYRRLARRLLQMVA
jgi:DDE family transposase